MYVGIYMHIQKYYTFIASLPSASSSIFLPLVQGRTSCRRFSAACSASCVIDSFCSRNCSRSRRPSSCRSKPEPPPIACGWMSVAGCLSKKKVGLPYQPTKNIQLF